MKTISQKVLTKIKDEEIKPIPEWHFSTKHYLLILNTLIWGLVGALSLAMATQFLVDQDWQIYQNNHLAFAERLFIDLPYIWLILLIAISIYIYFNIRHSETGYRWSSGAIIAAGLLAGLIFGLGLYFLGFGQKVDNLVDHNFSFYDSVSDQRIANWSRPMAGYLGGKVLSDTDSVLTLKDFQGNAWQIDISQTKSMLNLNSLEGSQIRIIGKVTAPGYFQARLIYAWPK